MNEFRMPESVVIRRVAKRNEFEAVSRFRYAIYVEEMSRKQKYADHANKKIIDPLDDDAVRLYAAWSEGEVVGTVRSNYLRWSDIGEYAEQFALAGMPDNLQATTSITTRLMVHSRYRNTPLAVRLACETYQNGLEDGITTDFIDCNDHLVPYFTGLGYLVHRNNLIHPEYGIVTVMRLNLNDLDHLDQVRSPFRKNLRAWKLGRAVTTAIGG
jgi:hypothetical protein